MTQYLIANFALMTAFLFLSSRAFKQGGAPPLSPLRFRLKLGAIHGLFGILLMFFSVRIDDETILDFRQIIIISAAHFGGIYASIFAGILIALGRITLFGGVNKSSIAATIIAIIMGVSNGLVAYYVQHYWKKWLLSIFISIIIVSGGFIWIMGWADAERIWVYFSVLILGGGLFIAYLIQYLDNSNRLVVRLEESEARYRGLTTLHQAIFQSPTEVAFIVTDDQGKITMFNSGAERLLGYRASEMIDIWTPELLFSPVELAERGQRLSQRFNRRIVEFEVIIEGASPGVEVEAEWTCVRKNGKVVKVNLMLSAVREDKKKISGYLLVLTDMTQKKQAEEQLREANRMLHELSRLDGLTQIPNRRAMDETMALCWEKAEQHSQPLSLILLDIDYFKIYNDTYGHLGGDQCLKRVASAIQGAVRREHRPYIKQSRRAATALKAIRNNFSLVEGEVIASNTTIGIP